MTSSDAETDSKLIIINIMGPGESEPVISLTEHKLA